MHVPGNSLLNISQRELKQQQETENNSFRVIACILTLYLQTLQFS